jgi:hypothetical protein
MRLVIRALAALALASLPALAQGQTPTPDSAQAAVAKLADGACPSKGCPKHDQHGHPPVSCAYKSGMATAWQCILLCTYEDSQWGTTVASSSCH